MHRIPALITTLLALISVSAMAQPPYSPGGWPTLHFDAGNRRAVSVGVVSNHYKTWSALSGASVLTAPVISPDGGALYVTTGLARGRSNLHAFSLQGELLWQSAPWQDAGTGVDPCALLSSPIVDAEGDIYLGDCNQLFAFTAEGAVKWVIDLPPPAPGDWIAAGAHPVNALTTAAFTTDGHLTGVTNFGDVILVDRATGEQLNKPFRLPSELSPYADTYPMPDSLLGDGMIDANFREWAWQVIFAGNMRSANTPAVARSGRMFVVGSSGRPGIGALFGLDVDNAVTPRAVRVAFATDIGIGSGSSPALSPDESQVYVSDEAGWLYAIDSVDGSIAWKVKTAAAAGAAAVGPDGRVYALQVYPAPAVIAVGADGEVLWESDTASLAADMPRSALLGEPVVVANGNPTVTADAVLVPVILGYRLNVLKVNLPVRSALVALDLDTGKAVAELVNLADDSSGITAVLPDGTLVNSLGGLQTSATSPLSPLMNVILPGDTRMLPPRGGIQVSIPRRK
ncbi:MAG: PQQ-binding-like beta-propeller repeat protein [Halioglobus sp.]